MGALYTLNKSMANYLQATIAEKTRNAYRNKFKLYMKFCILNTFKPFSEKSICFFVTYLAEKISLDAIRTYISAIRFYMRLKIAPRKMRTLNAIIEGIKRTIPQAPQQKPRLPISSKELKQLQEKAQQLNTQDAAMIWAACLVAYYGFMRVSELTTPNEHSHKHNNSLMRYDLQMHNNYMTILLRQSKTDKYKIGANITIAANNTTLCPIKAMKNYLKYRGKNPGPLFIFKSNKNLTPKIFNKFIKYTLPSTSNGRFTAHSFRIGAASQAAKAGCPKYIIKQAGRWKSDVYQRYIHLGVETFQKLSSVLANT